MTVLSTKETKMNYRKIWTDTFGPIIKGFHVHHITPRCEGGEDKIGNLIALHPDDHILIHKMRGDRWYNGVLVMRDGHSDAVLDKMSKSTKKSYLNPSREQQVALDNFSSKKGKDHGMYGKKHKHSSLIKLSEARLGTTVKTNESVAKMAYTKTDHRVHEFTHELHGVETTFCKDLANKYGISSSNLHQLVRGVAKSYRGWRLVS